MASENVTQIPINFTTTLNEITTLEETTVSGIYTIATDFSVTTELSSTLAIISPTESVVNTTEIKQLYYSDSPTTFAVFQAFIITEIVMTALELVLAISAAIKMPRWRRNYRNQMLMQLSLARFIKRVIFLLQFLEEHDKINTSKYLTYMLIYFQFYIDFVIVILVFFFIKHMYNSLLIVLVKIRQNNLYKVLSCSWLVPLPISAVCAAIIVTKVTSRWWVYLLICCIFRWPLIFIGTSLYVTILYRVMSDKIRKFARSLTVVTFFLCLIINFYLFSKDVTELWCSKSFLTLLVSYISGLILNSLILCFYVILLIFSLKNIIHCSRSLHDYSLADNNQISVYYQK